MQKQDRITILGITGYTGTWLAKKLTDAGYTNITGTYRDNQKMAGLVDELPNVKRYQGDLLTSPELVKEALVGTKWVFNNSAPFTGQEQTINDYIQTKVTAVNNLIMIINQVKTVKKLVHIGSAAAIDMGIGNVNQNVINEDTWPDLDEMDMHYEPFIDMKVYEEKRLRDLAAIIDLDVTVLHPTNIVGPGYMTWQHDMIYAYLHGSQQLVDGPLDCIDVRDVAGIEIALMNNNASNGKRVLGLGFTSTYKALLTSVMTNFDKQTIFNLFGYLPELVSSATAMALWQPIAYTSFYKDQEWRRNKQSILKTKYPDFYTYQYTDAKVTFLQAVEKMIADLG